jgi:hypothetical protein
MILFSEIRNAVVIGNNSTQKSQRSSKLRAHSFLACFCTPFKYPYKYGWNTLYHPKSQPTTVPQTDVSTKPIHHSPKDVVRQHTTFLFLLFCFKNVIFELQTKVFFTDWRFRSGASYSHNLRESLTKITTYNFMKRLTVLTNIMCLFNLLIITYYQLILSWLA